MARGEVAKDCKVGEGSTSSGRNSGSSAKRSSKSTSDRTLLESRQGHLLCKALRGEVEVASGIQSPSSLQLRLRSRTMNLRVTPSQVFLRQGLLIQQVSTRIPVTQGCHPCRL